MEKLMVYIEKEYKEKLNLLSVYTDRSMTELAREAICHLLTKTTTTEEFSAWLRSKNGKAINAEPTR